MSERVTQSRKLNLHALSTMWFVRHLRQLQSSKGRTRSASWNKSIRNLCKIPDLAPASLCKLHCCSRAACTTSCTGIYASTLVPQRQMHLALCVPMLHMCIVDRGGIKAELSAVVVLDRGTMPLRPSSFKGRSIRNVACLRWMCLSMLVRSGWSSDLQPGERGNVHPLRSLHRRLSKVSSAMMSTKT